MIVKETSERSSEDNWVRQRMQDLGLCMVSFEGYTIKGQKVSALFERRKLVNEEISEINPLKLRQDIVSEEGKLMWRARLKIAQILGVPLFLVVYPVDFREIRVFEWTDTGLAGPRGFADLREFGQWTFTYRDLVMKSRYQEAGLPKFDVELRRVGFPWPGNLDEAVYDPEKDVPVALLEFQMTQKATVSSHCNNDWFLPQGSRKGDEQRWRVEDMIRQHLNLPLVIIVWSPNTSDREVKVKVVDRIVYSNDPNREKPGLRYSFKRVVDQEGLQTALELIFPGLVGKA